MKIILLLIFSLTVHAQVTEFTIAEALGCIKFQRYPRPGTGELLDPDLFLVHWHVEYRCMYPKRVNWRFSWDAPTTMESGDILTPNEIIGYDIYIYNVDRPEDPIEVLETVDPWYDYLIIGNTKRCGAVVAKTIGGLESKLTDSLCTN